MNPALETREENSAMYGSLLDGIAHNLLGLPPSEIQNNDILELEILLNTIHCRAHQESWSAELQEAVLEALCRAGELSDTIKKGRPGAPRTKEFFNTAKRFTRLLQMLAFYLEEEVFIAAAAGEPAALYSSNR